MERKLKECLIFSIYLFEAFSFLFSLIAFKLFTFSYFSYFSFLFLLIYPNYISDASLFVIKLTFTIQQKNVRKNNLQHRQTHRIQQNHPSQTPQTRQHNLQ
jgi:hypothetical protein